MNYGKAFKQYKRSNVETAGKLELILMCYDMTMLSLEQAKDHLQNGEIDKKALKIQKAIDIISELQANLNFEKGGEIATGLDSLYMYIIKRVIHADIQKDYPAFNECIEILKELKSAWEGISATQENIPVEDSNTTQNIKRLSQIAA